jgi:hypothetical protein
MGYLCYGVTIIHIQYDYTTHIRRQEWIAAVDQAG